MNYSKIPVRGVLAALLTVSSIAMITGCSSSDDSTGTTGIQLSGVVVGVMDPYATGCSVTDSMGTAALEVDPVNSPGQYKFSPTTRPIGTITATGCTDAATGLPLDDLTMPGLDDNDATSDKLMVTPITTMVVELLAQQSDLNAKAGILAGITITNQQRQDAYNTIKDALGIPRSVNLATFDPLAAATSGDANGMAVSAEAIKLVNTVAMLKASTGKSADEIIAAMAAQILANPTPPGGSNADPTTDSASLTSLATELGLSATDASTIASGTSRLNSYIDDTVAAATPTTDTTELLTTIVATTLFIDDMLSSDGQLSPQVVATRTSNQNSIETQVQVMEGYVERNNLTSETVIADVLNLTGGSGV